MVAWSLPLHPLHIGAESFEPVVKQFVAALHLMDVVDDALAVGAEGGDDQRHTGPDVRAGELLAVES